MKKHLPAVPAAMLALLVLFALPSCKDKASDPLWVANHYFAAIEEGNAEKAYSYLSDRALLLKDSQGNEQRFMARPDLDTYKKIFTQLPKIKVTGLEKNTDLSREGELTVFLVTASTREQDRNVERTSAQFLLYLAPDKNGRWAVLLPRPQIAIGKGQVADSSGALGK
jgi:hypothetical protein